MIARVKCLIIRIAYGLLKAKDNDQLLICYKKQEAKVGEQLLINILFLFTYLECDTSEERWKFW